MKRKTMIIAAALSVTAAGGAAVAADALREKGPMRADTNGDGVVSRAEFFAAAEARFKNRDANGDRTLSGDEMKDRGGRFARIDTNNDGQLSFAEQAAATSARFVRLDADRDGKLTPEEMGPRRGRGPDQRGPGMGPRGGGPRRGAARLLRADRESN